MKQKGITLVSLCITIVVLIILAGVTLKISFEIINSAQLQNLNTNLLLVQIKCKTKAEQASFKNDDSILIGTVLSNIDTNEAIYSEVKALIDNGVINSDNITTKKMYLINQENLNNDLFLSDIQLKTNTQFFIVEYGENYETEEVYYTSGFEYNGTTYYKLSEIRNINLGE